MSQPENNILLGTSGWSYKEWVGPFYSKEDKSFLKAYTRAFKTVEIDSTFYRYPSKGTVMGWARYSPEGFVYSAKLPKLITHEKKLDLAQDVDKDLQRFLELMEPVTLSGKLGCFLIQLPPKFDYNINALEDFLKILPTSVRFAVEFRDPSWLREETWALLELSAGRVQAPTLVLLADKELEIKRFIPKPYWQLQLVLIIDGNEVIALYEKDKLWNKAEAEKIFKSCKEKPAIVDDVKKKKYAQAPPAPFNITSLQTEAYRLFGYSPQMTMSIAQKLYTSAYVSYPRTSSEKLPPQIGYKEIIEALSKIKKYESLCKALLALPSLKPMEGKKTDPAHEAIHPTVEPPKDIKKLSGPSQKVYDLICRRFLTHFAKEAIRESMQILIDVNGYKFSTTGRRTIEKGWTEFYGPYAKYDEIIFPDLKKGDKLNIKKLEMLGKETASPPRFSQASIIKEMERLGLGTRATRSAILQTLYDRNYVMDKSIRVTDLGLKIASVIKKYVPDFADEKLTRTFERELEQIMLGKEKKEKVLNKAKKAVTKICEEFKQHEDKIGKELGEAVIQTQNDKAVLGICPNCGGILKVMFSPFSKKMFVGCASYSKCKICGFTKSACKCKCPICGLEKGKCKCSWKDKKWNPSCQTGYPLPHGASFQRLDKTCEKCNTPMIQVIRKGKRPFRMCLDPKCETKADWGKPKKVSKKKKQI